MGPGPIPWTAVEEYADRARFDRDQREALHYHIRDLDEVYLKHYASELEKASKKKPPAPGGKGRGR